MSGWTIWTRSGEMPNSSATICPIVVSDPWPISTVLLSTLALPSALRMTMAPEIDGVSTAFTPAAMPLPRSLVPLCAARGFDHSMACAAWRIASLMPNDFTGVPVAKRSPSSNAGFKRNSTGSAPMARAIMSVCES